MERKLVLATRNLDKIRELSRMCSSSTKVHSVSEYTDDEVEETGTTLWENALLKAKAGFDSSGLPSVADDTGLEVDALGGEPGVYSARYAGEDATYQDNVDKLVESMKEVEDDNRKAYFKTVIAYVDATQVKRFEGVLPGEIIRKPRGESGFGYDPVFLPEGDDRTLAEMELQEKNLISHRGRAFASFLEWWDSAE